MPPAMLAPAWTLPTALFCATLLLTLVAYQGTVASFLQIWASSETFKHGFLVLPISAYLIWLKRDALATLEPRPFPLALLALLPIGLLWLAGRVTSTALVEQFSFVAFLPALVCALFGLRVATSIAFPLGFLFFCVPFGDVFRPSLMDLTADLAVRALRWTGVPVAREGLFLATPVAQWRVAEACSGLQFLVSGFALACLFAYVSYRSIWKRLVCAGLSIAVLILANGFRAYALILAGTLSDMRVGTGPEHYALGWVVYVLVLVAFFAVGSAFRDPVPLAAAAPIPAGGGRAPASAARTGTWFALAAVAALGVAAWPALYSYMSRPTPLAPASPISPPSPRAGWSPMPDPAAVWKPAFTGAASETVRTYAKGGAAVQCYLAFYEQQREGRELIDYRNVIARPDDLHWRRSGERDRRVRWGEGSLVVRETDVRGPDIRFLVWHWYWFPDEFTISREWAKLLQARASLLFHRDHAVVVVLSVAAGDNRDAERALQQFAADMMPSIRRSIQEADQSR